MVCGGLGNDLFVSLLEQPEVLKVVGLAVWQSLFCCARKSVEFHCVLCFSFKIQYKVKRNAVDFGFEGISEGYNCYSVKSQKDTKKNKK